MRQAIRLAVDVDQMLAAGYNGKAPRLNTLLPPQILGHWKDAPVYKRNVAEAKKLLAEAGATNLKLKLLILNQPAYQNMALVARALLAEVGVTLEVDAQEGGTYWNSGQGEVGKNLDLFLLRFNGKHDPNFIMQWFVSDQVGNWNWQRWKSPEYDSLFLQAAGELDQREARAAGRRGPEADGQVRRLRVAHERGERARPPQLDQADRGAGLDRLAVRQLRRRCLIGIRDGGLGDPE